MLVPLMLLVNASIGLAGFVDLSWKVGKYQGLFLLFLAAYVLSRGLLFDLMNWFSNLSIKYLKNGWLWTEAILKPIHHIARLSLFILACSGLFLAYGWDNESYVVSELSAIILFPLFHIGQTAFTLLTMLYLMIEFFVVYWIARWSREFSYRWLYNRVHDMSIRNSLAVFTQYTLVTLGVFVGLKIIGIDIQGMGFILGGLAVGIGFGLRDLANNFVSGIFLLIERPVRKGDLVTIGEYEGEVVHIGMRSLTIKTWDYTEVIVPNSKTFNGPFTNWTRLDNIVRTVIAVKIQRADDPYKVKNIICGVLEENADVLSNPEPQVFLKELDDCLIEFEIRYYINIAESLSRPAVRSAVAFFHMGQI